MKAVEDFYMLWIESNEATKYRNSPKYRYSEMMAFAEAYLEHQNKELINKAEKLMLKHFGFTEDGGIIAEEQLKIFKILNKLT